MNVKQESSPYKPLLYSTQLPILSLNGYQQNARFDEYNNPRDRFNQQYPDQYGQKRLQNQMQGEVVRKRPFGKEEEEEDEEIEEEAPKAEVPICYGNTGYGIFKWGV